MTFILCNHLANDTLSILSIQSIDHAFEMKQIQKIN